MKNKFKTLFLDIETSYNEVACWRTGNKINISPDDILKERQIVCISYKWANEFKITTVDWGLNEQNDKKLLKHISKVMLQADEIVAHNGDKFDLKWINGRLLYHNLSPLGPVTSSDTLKLSRKVFYLNSYKLDYLGNYTKNGRKIKTGGKKLWHEVIQNKCSKSLKKMIKYCEQDVKLLEKVYNQVIKFSPNINKSGRKGKICPNCSGTRTIKYGYFTSKAGIQYQKFSCIDCGTGFKSTIKEN